MPSAFRREPPLLGPLAVTRRTYDPGGHDYAGAWSAERGRCHRFVYGDEDGHPTECPAPPA
jgi:hypothetical protein